ncbi:hypothetical protein FRB99_002704 [Tulasnella sp. 403]|nr:hypothetical protein FRB99_002704 [Tulasnella sp. 403]
MLSLAFAPLLFGLLPLVSGVYSHPTVSIGSATLSGREVGKVDKFLGIPFAEAPRFDLPKPIPPQTQAATSYGYGCVAQLGKSHGLGAISVLWNQLAEVIRDWVFPESEECLSINVVKPHHADERSMLPVVVWIYGGAFTGGYSSNPVYDGEHLVSHSIEQGKPAVFVSFNYRVSAYGFLAGKEVLEAGVTNIGLRDQRVALQWVQRYIKSFGGDPSKVTVWGESSGAMSIGFHLIANGGDHENLFRAAFTQSGSVMPADHVLDGQHEYNFLVTSVGCSGKTDTLQCLRQVPLPRLQAALKQTTSPFDFTGLAKPAWHPRVDGTFIREPPLLAVMNGRLAHVPLVNSNTDDEGTVFALASQGKIRTDEEFKAYVSTYFLQEATEEERQRVFSDYPDDPRAGSPFGTGTENAVTPQFKRVAALLGDLAFQATRRFLLDFASTGTPTWTYRWKRYKWIPKVGSLHGSDLLNTFRKGQLCDYLINFAYYLDPNEPEIGSQRQLAYWPRYDSENRAMLVLEEVEKLSLGRDDDRDKPISFLQHLMLKYKQKVSLYTANHM